MQIYKLSQIALGKAERSSPSSNQYQITDTPSFFNRGFNAPGATHLLLVQTRIKLLKFIIKIVIGDMKKFNPKSAYLERASIKKMLQS